MTVGQRPLQRLLQESRPDSKECRQWKWDEEVQTDQRAVCEQKPTEFGDPLAVEQREAEESRMTQVGQVWVYATPCLCGLFLILEGDFDDSLMLRLTNC